MEVVQFIICDKFWDGTGNCNKVFPTSGAMRGSRFRRSKSLLIRFSPADEKIPNFPYPPTEDNPPYPLKLFGIYRIIQFENMLK